MYMARSWIVSTDGQPTEASGSWPIGPKKRSGWRRRIRRGQSKVAAG